MGFHFGIKRNSKFNLVDSRSSFQSSLMLPVIECISQLKWSWYAEKHKPLADFVTFDEASRGLAGSLSLIWKFHAMHLASIGALLTILALTIDPFIQQSVRYSPRNVLIDTGIGNASTPFITSWVDQQQVTEAPQAADNNPTFGILGAIYAGSLGLNPSNGSMLTASLTDVAPFCATGNCTWTRYTSLGVCASLANVTSHLNISYENESFNVTLPGGQYFNGIPIPLTNGPVLNITATDLARAEGFNGNFSLSYPQAIAFEGAMSPLAHAFVIYASDPYGLQFRSNTTGFTAFEFMLQWCVQTYDTTVNGGVPSTVLSPQQFPYTDFTWTGSTNIAAVPIGDDGPEFSVRLYEHWGLQTAFTYLLSTSLSLFEYGESFEIITTDTSSSFVDNAIPKFIWTMLQPTIGQTTHFQYNNMSLILQNIAISLSNYIRQQSNLTVSGDTYQSQTFVSVQWAWLALPFFFTALSLLFFIGTMLRQHRSLITPYKSSSLAVMQALGPDVHRALGGLQRPSMLEKVAEGVSVRLEKDEEEIWRLTSQRSDSE